MSDARWREEGRSGRVYCRGVVGKALGYVAQYGAIGKTEGPPTYDVSGQHGVDQQRQGGV